MKRRKRFEVNKDEESSSKKTRFFKGKVEKGSPEHRQERRRYLTILVREFEDEATKEDAKLQVLGNLANFGYDPYNADFFVELRVIQLFLGQLEVNNDQLVEFAIGGLCNCSPHPVLGRAIVVSGGIPAIKHHVFSVSTRISQSALTTLKFLLPYDLRYEIIADDFVPRIEEISLRDDKRLKNISTLFLKEVSQASYISVGKN